MMRKNRILLLLFFAVLSVLFFLPMLNLETMRLGVTRGDDYPFHYARISSIIEQIKATGSSQFVASFGSHEIFYGANIFYPPLTSAYPIAVLAIAFNSFISGYYVYLALLNFITLWFAYICSCYVIHCAVNKENQKNLTEIGLYYFQYSTRFLNIG